MNKSEQINELATALAAAQSELENASKSSVNPHFKSRYADLAEVINTVRPVFSKHGLALTQCPSFESGIVSVETILMHKSGQWMSSTISAPVSKLDAQGVGSATTYCRRYALAAIANIAQEDDDGESAVGRHRPAQQPDPQLPEDEFVKHIESIRLAADIDSLKKAYEGATQAARAANDAGAFATFTKEKDERKSAFAPSRMHAIVKKNSPNVMQQQEGGAA